MPGNNKHGTVVIGSYENWNKNFTKGSSNLSSLETAFAGSPLYDQSYSFQALIDAANKFLVPMGSNQPGDPAYFPKGVDLSFSGRDQESGPPSYNNVQLKINGRVNDAISSPFTPNTASPGPGPGDALNFKPQTSPVPVDQVVSSYANKSAAQTDPMKAANQISTNVKLGSKLSLGYSGADSNKTDAG